MLYNYFKIARRNLWNNKGYTLINSIGLAAGISIFALVLLYVNNEKSYDKWDKKLQQVYRAGISEKTGGGIEKSPSVQYPLGAYLASECPEVASVTRVRPLQGEKLVTYNSNSFFNQKIIAADSNFFAVFPYKFLFGNAQTALNKPQTIVISHAISEKIFGNANPVGKTLKLDNSDVYTITGVIEKTGPSHLSFEICLSNNSAYFAANWFMKNQDTYLLLKPNSNVSLLQKRAQDIYLKYNKLVEKNTNPMVFFEPVGSIHLSSEGQILYGGATVPVYDFGGSSISLAALLFIGIAILLLSCINYTNMAIARAAKRAKESGLRKVLGASRKQIILQFLAEAFIQSAAAAILALYFTWILKNILNNTLNLNLNLWSDVNGGQNFQFLLQLVLIVLAVTIISGFYPAFILARLAPAKVLRGDTMRGSGGYRLRNILVVFQYSIATCFIISIFIVGLQMRFMHSKNPGFNTNQTLRIQVRPLLPKLFPGQPGDKSQYVAGSLAKIPGITAVSMSDSYPGAPAANIQQASAGGKTDTLSMRFNFISFGYFNLLGMRVTQGRAFDAAYATDSVNAAVINQTAVQKLGWKDAIDKKIEILGRQYKVIGVLSDAYLSGYGNKVMPEIYAVGVKAGNFFGHSNLLVKVDGNRAKDVLQRLSAFWKTVDPGFPMRYSWLDKDFEKLIEKDERFSKITGYLTLAAVLLAGMGILSLSAFTAERRTKEIGIRKVLGATVAGIVNSFFAGFLKLVCISVIIAFPIAWLATDKWLQGFAYHIQIQWWMFFTGGIIAMLIALLTVSYQAVKAAMANPVNSLRGE